MFLKKYMNKKIIFILFSFCNIFADEEITQEGINDREKTNEGNSTPNLGSKEDFLDYKDLNNSRVEENILTNKNNWNTRKWGSIYFLFPHLTYWSIYHKFAIEENNIKKTSSFIGPIERKFLRILNFILSGIVEYKWMFHKYCGINVRLNLNNIEAYYSITKTKDCNYSEYFTYASKLPKSQRFGKSSFVLAQALNLLKYMDYCKG